MASLSTVADVIREQNNGQAIVLTLANQGRFAFQLNGANATLTLPNPLAPSNAGAPSPVFNAAAVGVPFRIKVCGMMSSNARGQQYQIDVVLGTGTSPAALSTGLQTIPTGAGTYSTNWGLIGDLMWDSVSDKVRGFYHGWAGEGNVTQSAILGAPTAAALSNLQFTAVVVVPGPTIGTPAPVFTLTEFSVSIE